MFNPFSRKMDTSPGNNHPNLDNSSSIIPHPDYPRKNSRSLLTTFITTVGAVMTSVPMLILFGSFADWITVHNFFNKPDSKIKTGWVMTKITGSGHTMYPSFLFGIFDKNIGSSSKIRSMIYTDFPVKDLLLHQGGGYTSMIDLSVLINKDQDFDYRVIDSTSVNQMEKINSQTLQSRLIKAHENEEVLCIAVNGYRDNNKSEYFNIIDIKPVAINSDDDNQLSFQEQYQEITDQFKVSSEQDNIYSYSDAAVKNAYRELEKLTELACEVSNPEHNIFDHALKH